MNSTRKPKSLFEHFLVIQLESAGEKELIPVIKYVYTSPNNLNSGPENNITQFVYPDLTDIKLTNSSVDENYIFVLTQSSGKYSYGYCRRFLATGVEPRYPLVLCLVSRFYFVSMFEPLLEVLQVRWQMKPQAVFPLLQSLLCSNIPIQGEIMRIKQINYNNMNYYSNNQSFSSNSSNIEPLLFQRNDDLYNSPVSFQTLFKCLSLDNILLLFSALLCEQKLIFVSNSLTTLSNSIHAAIQLLKPLEWHHIFIPILPNSLYTALCAPMPYTVGLIGEHNLTQLFTHPIDDCIVIYLDRDIIQVTAGIDRLSSGYIPKFDFPLPDDLVLKLKKHLKATQINDQNIFDAFLGFFICLFGNYCFYHYNWFWCSVIIVYLQAHISILCTLIQLFYMTHYCISENLFSHC